ncbi:MAG: amino acid adenylation domain-containing protein, partial [Janthinobacterium lividum]
VPSAIAALERSNAIPASVRVINLAGEALPNPLVQTLYRRPSLEQVYNLYGPTEDTTYSTYTSIPRGASTPCPIGGPIAGTRAHVVDGGLAEVPIGVSGELCLAGDGLARGYLNRPALTAERFVPNPFGAAGERMYRTGDLVQRRPDGSLNYLGRIDTQIKLRGFRIELGEIETALRAHPAVTECAVIVRGNGEEAQLLAYFAPQTVAIDALRAHLSGTLPNYMVPSVFMPVARLPLTSNGKLDRKALPECDATAASSRFGEAPRGDLEQRLANIWQQLLHVAHVSRSDNFFVIGGHSLLATRLVSQIRDTFGRELPLRALFETPILAELAERLRAGDDTAPSEPLIMPITRDAALPLSFAQQRLWFIDQMQPGSALYNMPVALQLDGALDVDALSRTLAALLARHEALRTRIVAHDGVPLQIVDPAPLHFALDVVDLSHHPEPDVCALDEARAEAGRPFDLANGPLLRARLLKLAPIRHVMLLTVHHIASDGWSMGVLVREFVALYPALRDGLPSPLAASALQYADYAAWQRAWLGGARLDAQLHYWSERLAGAPRLLSLPTDHPRPPTQDYDGAFHTFRLDAALTASLEALATEHRATMFMVLSAAFALVLGRHAGQDEVCLGTPVANRTRSEVENLVGCFVNTLVLRIGLDPKASFADLLIQTRETALAAYAHQDVPFEQLVDVLQVERDPSHTPLFQASIVLQNAHTEALRVPGIDIVPLPMAGTTSKFDLTLFAEPQASGALSCSLEYRTALFSADTIVRLGAHLTTLLQAVASDAQQRILVLPMLSGCERDDLERWRTRAVDLSQGADAGDAATTLGERFALQVALTPERIAIACGNESLTYADLDRQATRLAAQLRRAGAGPDRLVAVLAERSVWLPLAFVAVLKAGAVYLPLDPEHPSERHAATIDDARPVALLTQRRFAADSPLPTLPIVCMDDGAVDEPDTHEHATAKVFPDHLAYMIYTSGSTGKPKGAMISHRATVNLLDGLCREIYGVERFDASRRLTLNASAAFDASLQQLVMLCAGATLLPVPTDVRRDPARLLAFLASERIDVFDCTPQQLAALLAFAPHAPLPAHILTGGEAIEPGLWQSLRKHAGTRVHNLYGPTECTVDAITARLDASVTPLIGAPLPNVSAAVLNTALEPVPAGVTGELYLGGPGLARGYFRRPDLTAESFMPDPSGPPGARRYRTGDLVRHRRDGTLDFVGRADTQIKLRGFRIEPAEIEAALTEMDGIVEALVLASEGPAGQAMLIAWIVSERGAARPDTAMLLAALRKRLPYYMVPAAVVPLERMPLTPGGKVDRRALPPPTFAAGRHFSPPATQTEQRIATIWAEVLGIAQIGRDDSFFDLGGNSLSAVQLVSRMERATGIALPLHVLFEEPTIVGIARAHAALQDLNDHEADTGPLDSAELLI